MSELTRLYKACVGYHAQYVNEPWYYGSYVSEYSRKIIARIDIGALEGCVPPCGFEGARVTYIGFVDLEQLDHNDITSGID